MKAVVQQTYGNPEDVLELRDVDMPSLGDDDVLVQVRAASVHADVWHSVTGRPYVMRIMGSGVLRPKHPIPGTDMAGNVEAVGKNVTRFQVGDAVFGETISGNQWINGGAFAEFVVVPENFLAHKPDPITFEQAAAIPTSGLIALHNLPKTLVRAGRSVLINGAAGGVGSIALQLAKAHGARITGVDCANKLDMMRQLGADRVIDFARTNSEQQGERYDVIFDVASTLTFAGCKRALTPEGLYVRIGHDHYGEAGGHIFGSLPYFFKLLALAPFEKHLPKLNFKLAKKQDAMAELSTLIEAEKLTTIIDRTYPLSKVPEAIRYLAEGQSCGRIVITP